MKTISYGAFCLLMAMNAARAAELVQINIFGESDETCEGTPVVREWSAVVGYCRIVGGTIPTKFTSCLVSETYESLDCSGEPDDSDLDSSVCIPLGSSSSTNKECMTVPDHKVGRFQEGSSCTEDGEVAGLYADDVFVLDECMPYDFDGTIESYLYTLNDGIITFTVYLEQTDCTGPTLSFNIEVGSCVEFTQDYLGRRRRRRLQDEGDIIVRKVTPVVTGATLSNTPPPETSSPTPETSSPTPETSSPTPETSAPTEDDNGDDDGGGKNNTGNGNDAMTGSTSAFALVAIMVGALTLMF